MRTPWLRDPNRRRPARRRASILLRRDLRTRPRFVRQLTAALDAGDVAAVLLRLADVDERTLINCAKALAPPVQSKDAALLLDGRPDLVARAGADGAHLTGLAAFTDAVGDLKPERIVGAGGLVTRHDAMLVAEQGADYVMFGEPTADGERPAKAAIEDRVAWWAEVFEIPCVGYRGVSRGRGTAGGGRCRFRRARGFSLARSGLDRGNDERSSSRSSPAGAGAMSARTRVSSRSVRSRSVRSPCRRKHRLPKTYTTVAVADTGARPPRLRGQSNIDIAYGAYQRGYYITAFNEASKRAQQNDPAAMTLLGEIYAQGLGVGRDDAKAAQWYKLAAAKGDRDAMFALAMFNFQGRAGARDLNEAARLLESAARLGHAAAAYNLGLLYMQGEQFAQDFKRAGELFAIAAEAGNPEAQYALATMYKEGRGVSKDMSKAMRLMQQASIAGNTRRHGRVRDCAIQRGRHAEGRGGGRTAVPESGAPRQSDRAESRSRASLWPVAACLRTRQKR